MAVPDVTVKATWDSTDFERGTEDAERAVEDLAREVDYAADKMNTSLRSIDDGVSSTLGPTGTVNRQFDDFGDHANQTMGEAGAEVASEFGSNLAEGISSGDTSATVLDSMTGLGATLASAGGALAFAGVGALVGGALVSGIVNRIKTANQAIVDAINESFQAVEVNARQTNRAIKDAYLDTLNFKDTLTNIGGGDAQKGFETLTAYAEDFGFAAEDAVNLINREMTPGARGLRDAIKEVGVNTDQYVTRLDDGQVILDDVVTSGSALNRILDEQRQKQEGSLRLLESERNAKRDIKDDQRQLTNDARDYYEYTRLAADAAGRLGGNLTTAARQAGIAREKLAGLPLT